MKNAGLLVIAIAMLIFAAADALASDKSRQEQQAALDAACEAARKQKIAVERKKHVDECVEKKQQPDRATCERFYADYGERSGSRPPLYYDLPACEEADAFRRSPRSTRP